MKAIDLLRTVLKVEYDNQKEYIVNEWTFEKCFAMQIHIISEVTIAPDRLTVAFNLAEYNDSDLASLEQEVQPWCWVCYHDCEGDMLLEHHNTMAEALVVANANFINYGYHKVIIMEDETVLQVLIEKPCNAE